MASRSKCQSDGWKLLVLIISSRCIRSRWFVVAPLARLCAFSIAQLWSRPFIPVTSVSTGTLWGVTWVGLMWLDGVIYTGHILLAMHWIHVTSDVLWLQTTPTRLCWLIAPTFTARESSASTWSCGGTISPAIYSCAGNWRFEVQGFRDTHRLRIAGVSGSTARDSYTMASSRLITLRPAVDSFPRRSIRMFFFVMVMTMSTSVVLGQDATPPSFLDNYGSLSDQQHFRVLNNGQQVQLVLDQFSGNLSWTQMPSGKSSFNSLPYSVSRKI